MPRDGVRRRARSQFPDRGPTGSGRRMQPTPSSTVASAPAGRRREIAPTSPSAQARAATARGSAQPASRAAALRSGIRRLRVADQNRGELAAAAAATVLDFRLGLRVALHRVGGKLVYIGEDRLGEQAQHLGVEPGAPTRRGDPPPGDPGPDPIGRLQGVERPALPQLAAAERDVDLAADPAAALGIADQGDELAQRLLHPRPGCRARNRPPAAARTRGPRERSRQASRRRRDRARARSVLATSSAEATPRLQVLRIDPDFL